MRSPFFYFSSLFKVLALVVLRAVAYFWPRNSKLIVIGGWRGELYIDNSKYLLEYLLEHTEFEVVWVGKEHICNQLPKHERLSFVVKDSLSALWCLLNARTWICCQSINADLTSLPILGRAVCIDLWHGIPIKYVGTKTPNIINAGVKASLLGCLYQKVAFNFSSWLVVSNSKMVNILCEGISTRYDKKRVLRIGTPRNDFLIQHADDKELQLKIREKYSKLLGFDSNRKIILYLPTWRMCGDDVFTFYNQSCEVQEKWKNMLDENHSVLIEKHHWGTYARYPLPKNSTCSIAISASQQNQIDIQELLLVADMLISDYSGAYIDFALLRRSVVHFAYDLEKYVSEDSGLAYNLHEVAAGPIVSDVEQLESAVGQLLKHPMFTPAKGFADLVEYEKGVSSARIVDFIRSEHRIYGAC